VAVSRRSECSKSKVTATTTQSCWRDRAERLKYWNRAVGVEGKGDVHEKARYKTRSALLSTDLGDTSTKRDDTPGPDQQQGQPHMAARQPRLRLPEDN
jgi:hypothetical protein